MKASRVFPVLIFILILAFGFFRIPICRIFSMPISFMVEYLGFSSAKLLEGMNEFSLSTKSKDHYMGWFIYYPSYLLLHFLFIWTLFKRNKSLAKKIMMGLLVVVSTLITVIMISHLLEFHIAFKVCYNLFRNLIGLPFILLVIEGGRILINDIDNLLVANRQ